MLLANRLASTLDPWRIMQALENQWNQFGDWAATESLLASQGGVRYWNGDGQAVVEFDLPGHAADRFDVSVNRNLLTVDVRPMDETAAESGEYHVRERMAVEQRQVRLPFVVDPQHTDAEYRNGILRITVQQPESHRPAQIAVKGA